jgi:hypothetical protein
MTVLQEYERTGYVWEQYDALTGEGRRRSVDSYLAHEVYFPNHFISLQATPSRVGHPWSL